MWFDPTITVYAQQGVQLYRVSRKVSTNVLIGRNWRGWAKGFFISWALLCIL